MPTEKSGIPNVIFNLLSNFPKDSVKLGYVSINDPSDFYNHKLRDIGAELYIVPRKISHPLRYIRQLAKIAHNYDVIHVHGNSATMVLEMIAAKMAGVPFRIAHCHNTTCGQKLIDKLARPLFYSLCNGRIACGKEAGNWLFGSRDFKVINNGINVTKFKYSQEIRNNLRECFGIGNEPVIGHIGNFNYQKNHIFLIKIFKEVILRCPGARLLLLGDGPLKVEVKEQVMKAGLSEAVIWSGSVDNPQDYMNMMDLVIMPSRFEGLPLTMVEEQANGLTVLASDIITKDANITGKVFYKSLKDPVSEWVDRAIELLDKDKRNLRSSENYATQIRNAGFDINGIAQELIRYYNSYPSGVSPN